METSARWRHRTRGPLDWATASLRFHRRVTCHGGTINRISQPVPDLRILGAVRACQVANPLPARVAWLNTIHATPVATPGVPVEHDYEKLGAFYLGEEMDPASGEQ